MVYVLGMTESCKLTWWECGTCERWSFDGHSERGTVASAHDPCISKLPGVENACCGGKGHGSEGNPYVAFSDGRVLRDAEALAYFASVGKGPPA